jgi:sensor domain CHASE-containing protein
MRRLVSFLVLVVVVLVVIGLWRGWFTILFNRARFQHDEQRVEQKIDTGVEQLKHDVHKDAQKVDQKTGN